MTIEERAREKYTKYSMNGVPHVLLGCGDYIQGATDQKEIDKALIPQWISVNDRLPDYGVSVLACFENGSITITHRTKNDFSKDNNDFLHQVYALDITHWMPLPEPPKAMEE